MLTKRKVLYAKEEGTYNTDPTPGATDAVLVENLSWSNEGLKMIERPAVRPVLGALAQVYGGRLVSVSFDAEVKGSGAAGTAPEIGVLLRGCGLGETIVAATSVIYAPVSTALESITLYLFEDGKQIIVTGARGNVSFNLEAGNKVMASFTFTGHVAAQTDVALASPTLDSTTPEPYVGGSFTIDGFAGVINALSFDLGNTIATPSSVNAADGYGEIQIVGRDINGSCDPEDELVATQDWVGDFASGKSMALASGAIGSTAGNILAITMPAVYYRDVTPGDRDGVATLELPFGSAAVSTDADVSMAFT